jgi:hypothetical protein
VIGPWIAGYNIPGYMPETEPSLFNTWLAAVDYLVEELEQSGRQDADDGTPNEDYYWAATHLRDQASDTEWNETVGRYNYWLQTVHHNFEVKS